MIFNLIFQNVQFLEILIAIKILKLSSLTNQRWPQQAVKSIVRLLSG